MNERIKELAENAGFGSAWFEQSPPGYPALPREGIVEGFAKQIIQECATLTLDYKNQDYYEGWLDYREEIKRHFGITA